MKKILALSISIFCLAYSKAQTPFDSFDSTMAKTPIHKAQNTPKFIIPIKDSIISYLKLDAEEKTIAYYNAKDSLLASVALGENKIKWLSIDPLASKYPGLSPYNFVDNTPIRAIDPDGQDIYILFYTNGNKRGDEMFRASALTRKTDIERSNGFDLSKDIVVVISLQDMATIQRQVNNIVKTLSPQYGQTQEFSIWSHAAPDGPTGTVETSADALDKKQMSISGWSKIDFNWKNNGKGTNANFFGCKTGVEGSPLVDLGTGAGFGSYPTPSFANKISSLQNFRNVNVAGQTSSAYPSQFTNFRLNSENGPDNFINFDNNGMIYFQRTYLVGGNASYMGLNSNSSQAEALPMQYNINGKTTETNFQLGTSK